jgi:membrane-bound ClpP family serine protease
MKHDAGSRVTSSTFIRYLGFQVPGTVVVAALSAIAAHYDIVSVATAAGVLCLWIAKDLALYPLLKRAYEPSGHGYPERLIDRRGRAREKLDPLGYVVVAGELWRAEARSKDRPIRKGETVVVTGTVGTRLIVRRLHGDEVARSA